MSTFLVILAGLFILGFGVLIVYLQWKKFYILQYLFFCRYPILAGLVLFLFPIVAVKARGLGIYNLFVLNGTQVAVVTWLALLAAWSVMYSLGLVYVWVPVRYDLPIRKEQKELYNVIPPFILEQRTWLFAVLALPNIYLAVSRSSAPWLRRLLAVGVGAILAFAMRWVAREQIGQLFDTLLSPIAAPHVSQRVLKGVVGHADPLTSTYGSDARTVDAQRARGVFRRRWAFAFLLVTLSVYVLGYWVLRPDRFEATRTTPAVAFLLLLLIVVTWLLTLLGFLMDKWRIPPLLALALGSILIYALSDSDHYYDITRDDKSRPITAGQTFGPAELMRAWDDRFPAERYPVVVIVAASGGGIRAAYWTSVVLTRLQEQMPETFASSIVLLSTVSGGGVGAMYYVNAFADGRPPTPSALDEVRSAAGSESLSASAWGQIYPDFFRAITGGLLPRNKLLDRAWSLEEGWNRYMDIRDARLSAWREDVMAANRPPQVFNATMTESGARYLISPLDWPAVMPPSPVPSYGFWSLYPDADIRIVTAARLSATFPYLTPIARPWNGEDTLQHAFHIADGGYVDNFGMMTVVDFLKAIGTDTISSTERRCVCVIQIHASPAESNNAEQKRGWLYAVAGPAYTMLNVRESSQPARNEEEFGLLSQLWERQGLRLRKFDFRLNEDLPLSWKLTRPERETIRAEWKKNAATLYEVRMNFTDPSCRVADSGGED